MSRVRARSGAVAAVAAACVIALTGCSVVDDVSTTTGSLIAGAGISAALDQATRDLESIDGVTVTSATSEIQPDYTYQVSLSATAASALTEDDAARAMETVRALFAGDAFADGTPRFELRSDSTPLSLDGSAISEDELAAEVAYLYALASAYGSPLGMSIGSVIDEDGTAAGYSRQVRSLGERPVDPVALAAVVDTPTGSHDWELAGISATGSLPPAAAFALLERIAGVATVLDYTTGSGISGVHLQWFDGNLDLDLTSETLETGMALVDSPDFATVRAVVALGIESGIRLGQFSYYAADGSEYATAGFAGCVPGDSTARDAELVAALAPVELTAGYCVR